MGEMGLRRRMLTNREKGKNLSKAHVCKGIGLIVSQRELRKQ